MDRKYDICFSMCHCEYTTVELDEEDIQGLSEDEIKTLIRKKAWHQIRQECTEYEAEEIIEIRRLK